MKVVGGHLVHQMKELQQKVLRLERERESSLSCTDIEKELQIQVGHHALPPSSLGVAFRQPRASN